MADVEMPDAAPAKTKASGPSKAAKAGTADEGKKRFEVKKARTAANLIKSKGTAD